MKWYTNKVVPYYEEHADLVKTKYRAYFICSEQDKVDDIHHLLCYNEPTDSDHEYVELESVNLGFWGPELGFRYYVIAENFERAKELAQIEINKIYPKFRDYIHKSRYHWKKFAWICKQNNSYRGEGFYYKLPYL